MPIIHTARVSKKLDSFDAMVQNRMETVCSIQMEWLTIFQQQWSITILKVVDGIPCFSTDHLPFEEIIRKLLAFRERYGYCA